jgi:hypothetical protein
LNFNNDGDKILTGAFDGTAIVNFINKIDLGYQNWITNSSFTRPYRINI